MNSYGKDNIVKIFETNGYLASDAGKKGDPNDPEYVARWIICNLVDGLKNHPYLNHQAIEVQIEEWRKLFGDENDLL